MQSETSTAHCMPLKFKSDFLCALVLFFCSGYNYFYTKLVNEVQWTCLAKMQISTQTPRISCHHGDEGFMIWARFGDAGSVHLAVESTANSSVYQSIVE